MVGVPTIFLVIDPRAIDRAFYVLTAMAGAIAVVLALILWFD